MPFWPVISLCILISVFGINKIWISYGNLDPSVPRLLVTGHNPNGCDFPVPWDQMHCHATHKFSPEQFGIIAMGMEGHSTNSERVLCGVVPMAKQGFQPNRL